MKRVLVAGATGYLGRYMVHELKKHGYHVRILVRNRNKIDQPGPFLSPSIAYAADEVVVGDLTDPESLSHICNHIDYVFSSVGLTRQKAAVSFHDVDYEGNVHLLKEAIRSGVSKFMYIHVFLDENWQADGLLVDAKNRFVQTLKASAINHIVIRPTGYFSDMTPFLTMAKKGRVFLIGNGKMKMNPIHGKDLAHYCVQSFAKENETLDVGGPEILTHEQITQIAFGLTGQKKRTTHIPVWVLKGLSHCLKVIRHHYYGLLQFFILVITHDIIAPRYGKYKIKDYFRKLLE